MGTKKPTKNGKRDNKKDAEDKRKKIFVVASCVVAVALIVVLCLLFGRSSIMTQRENPHKLASQGARSNDQSGDKEKKMDVLLLALRKAKLQLETVDNHDILRLIVEKTSENDGREITYTYNWTKNGQPAGNGTDSLSGFKRGDKIAVKVTPFVGEKSGQSRTLNFEMQNANPKVMEGKIIKDDGSTLTYQVNAYDPDGDTLSYSLVDPSAGVTINSTTGQINWKIREEESGKYTIKVKISDNKGEIIYPIETTLEKRKNENKS